jgi:hypothetical protein
MIKVKYQQEHQIQNKQEADSDRVQVYLYIKKYCMHTTTKLTLRI